MTSTVLVTGGTGTLGRLVTPLLARAGAKVRVLSRHGGDSSGDIEHFAADLLQGEGIQPAVDGADVVLHLAGGRKGDDVATANLMRAAAEARVRHVVFISVIGADRVPLSWLGSKLRAERAVAASSIPWTTLRAAQFHQLIFTVVRKMARLPVIPIPGGVRFEPVDARDVAERMAELTLGHPAGSVPDLAGPQVYTLGELVRGYLLAQGKRRPLLPIHMPGKAGRAYRAGANLARYTADHGTRTWEAFLAE
jgi:uncharacterized protein YbjT (DUF2867 family)